VIAQVNSETVSLERLREFIKAAELLADNEIDLILPFSERSASVYANAIRSDLMELLERRESAEYRQSKGITCPIRSA